MLRSLHIKVVDLLLIKDTEELEDILDTISSGSGFYIIHKSVRYQLSSDQILFMKHLLPEYVRLKLPKFKQVMHLYELPFENEYVIEYDVDNILSLFPKLFPLSSRRE